MTQRDNRRLVELLRNADPDEVELFLLSYFGSGQEDPGVGSKFRRPGEEDALSIRYKNNKPSSVEMMPGAKPGDLAALVDLATTEFADEHGFLDLRTIFFATHKLRGAFSSASVQLLPVPPTAPQIDYAMGEHPFIVEHRVRNSTISNIRLNRQLIAEGHIATALGVIANATIKARISPHPVWVVERDGDKHRLNAKCLQAGYTFDELESYPAARSDLSGFVSVARQQHAKYDYDLNVRYSSELVLADDSESQFEKAMRLIQNGNETFIRASFWYRTARTENQSSAAFVAYMQCLESLLPAAQSKRCRECNQEMFSPIAARIGKLFESLTPDVLKPQEVAKRLYKMRSKLTHGAHLMRHDQKDAGMTFAPVAMSESRQLFDLAILSKAGLRAWLRLKELDCDRVAAT